MQLTTVLGVTLRNKASILKEQGNFDAATETFNKVLIIQLETVGEMHPMTATTYEELALVHIQQGMIEGAIKVYTKAIKSRRKELGNDHTHAQKLVLSLAILEREKHAKTLNGQGLAMYAKADSEKAMQLFQEALGMYKGISGVCPSIAVVYASISAVKIDQGLLEDALAESAESLKIRQRRIGDDHANAKRRVATHRYLLKLLLKNRR